MTKRALIAAGLVAALGAGSAVAIAQPGQGGPGVFEQGRRFRGGPGGPGGPRIDLGLRGIDLTDAQRDQVRAINASHRTEIELTRNKLREAHRTLADAAQADTLDEAAIRAGSADVASAMADEAILQAKVRGEVMGILTAEQLQQVKDRRAAIQKRVQERLQQRKQRRPGQ